MAPGSGESSETCTLVVDEPSCLRTASEPGQPPPPGTDTLALIPIGLTPKMYNAPMASDARTPPGLWEPPQPTLQTLHSANAFKGVLFPVDLLIKSVTHSIFQRLEYKREPFLSEQFSLL